jgi:hypothetical protein
MSGVGLRAHSVGGESKGEEDDQAQECLMGNAPTPIKAGSRSLPSIGSTRNSERNGGNQSSRRQTKPTRSVECWGLCKSTEEEEIAMKVKSGGGILGNKVESRSGQKVEPRTHKANVDAVAQQGLAVQFASLSKRVTINTSPGPRVLIALATAFLSVLGSRRLTCGSVLKNNIGNIGARDFGKIKIISGCVAPIFPIFGKLGGAEIIEV